MPRPGSHAAAIGCAAALVVANVALADPPAPKADVVPAGLDDVEHLCALLTGCEDLPLSSSSSATDLPGCVRALRAELASGGAITTPLAIRECGLRAGSCGDLRKCALRGTSPDACAGRGSKGGGGVVEFCDDGGRAVTCAGEHVKAVLDCPRSGEQCVLQGGRAACALGSCGEDAPPACSKSGTRVVECKKGKLLSHDCGSLGLKCATVDGPRGRERGRGREPECATGGAACAEGAARCDGATAVACFHGHEVRVDCAAAGMTCGGDGSAVGACTAPAAPTTTCDPGGGAASAPRCEGARLAWCAYGVPRSYLCKSMGFSRCVSDDKGARCAH